MSHRRSRHAPASSADRPTAPPPTNPEEAAEEYRKAVIAEAKGGDFTEYPLTLSAYQSWVWLKIFASGSVRTPAFAPNTF